MSFRKLILFINFLVFSASCLAETEKLKIKKIVINGNNITKNETILEHIAITKFLFSSTEKLRNRPSRTETATKNGTQ